MAEDNDDLLDPAEIEALLNEAGAEQPAPPPTDKNAETESPTTPATEESAQSDSEQLSQDDLDQLLAGAGGGAAPTNQPPPEEAQSDGDLLDPSEIEKLLNAPKNAPPTATATTAPTTATAAPTIPAGTEELLQKAEAGLAAAISPDAMAPTPTRQPVGNPTPFAFEEFGKSKTSTNNVALNTLHDVALDIRIELGRTELLIDEVLQLRNGAIVPLDKLAGDPVDVIVNERLIARGEVLVLNDNFCVRITEILPPDY